MSLYGYPREPEPTDGETPESWVPQQRIASEPVAVPAAPPPAAPAPADPLFGALPDTTQRVAAAPVSQVPSPLPSPHLPSTPSIFETMPPFPEPGFPSFGESTFPGFAPPAGALAERVPADLPAAAEPPVAKDPVAKDPVAKDPPVTKEPSEPGFSKLPALSLDDEIDAALDEPSIPPWDRKPLMVVIAAAAVLVLLAIISGAASAAMFPPGDTPASWREAETQPSGGPSPAGPAAPAAAGQETVTLSGVGDVIMGTAPASLPPNNGVGFFDPVKEALAADLVMGNLETPLTDDTGFGKCGNPPAENCFQFYVPPSYANYLRDAGFEVVNLANNHTNDMGPQGLANTRAALTAAGVQHTGGVGQITYATVKGLKVAVLGFSVYSWGASLNNIQAAADLVKQADAEADLVVIQMQGGAEGSDKTHVTSGPESFLGEDRGDLIAFSHAVVDAGADVVFGHGPHVMRGMEFYKGRLIAYSLGNFCGYRVLSSTGVLGVGGVLKVTLTKDGTWAAGKLVATEMVNGGQAAPDSDQRALDLVNGLSRTDFGGSAATISTADGTITPPAS